MSYNIQYISLLNRGIAKRLPDHVDRSPIPAVADYQKWIDEQHPNCRHNYDAHKLRRIAVMRRRLEPWTEIARALRMAPGTASSQYRRLPERLR